MYISGPHLKLQVILLLVFTVFSHLTLCIMATSTGSGFVCPENFECTLYPTDTLCFDN